MGHDREPRSRTAAGSGKELSEVDGRPANKEHRQ